MEIKELVESFNKVKNEMLSFMDAQKQELSKHGETSEKTGKAINEHGEKLIAIDQEIKKITGALEEVQKKAARLPQGGPDGQEQIKSLGEQFVTSEAFKRMQEGKLRTSEPVMVKGSVFGFGRKDLSTVTGDGGVAVHPYRVPQIIYPVDRQFRLRDLLAAAPIESNSIDYIEEIGFAPLKTVVGAGGIAAGSAVLPVGSTQGMFVGQRLFVGDLVSANPQAALPAGVTQVTILTVDSATQVTLTANFGGAGAAAGVAVMSRHFAPIAEKAARPQGDIKFEKVSTSVKTIGHWIPASVEVLQDVSQIRSYIDNRLTYGLKMSEEHQILYGLGTGNQIKGICTNARRQTHAQGADTKLDAVRKAITKARLAELPATGIVMHPSDWQDIELAKGSTGYYLWVNVNSGGEQQLWKLPVVDTTAINQGEFLTGAFGIGAQLWDRAQATVRIAEQHGTFFVEGMVAMLAEERLCQTVVRPEAFVHGTFA
jgi:hypothetical protein